MRRRLLLCTIVLLSCFQTGADKQPRISIYSPGSFATEPADWWVRVQVDPQPENRWVVVEFDGQPGMFVSDGRPLQGEKEPLTVYHQLWFKGLSQGCYHITAAVGAGEKVLGRATAPLLHVLGPDGDLCG